MIWLLFVDCDPTAAKKCENFANDLMNIYEQKWSGVIVNGNGTRKLLENGCHFHKVKVTTNHHRWNAYVIRAIRAMRSTHYSIFVQPTTIDDVLWVPSTAVLTYRNSETSFSVVSRTFFGWSIYVCTTWFMAIFALHVGTVTESSISAHWHAKDPRIRHAPSLLYLQIKKISSSIQPVFGDFDKLLRHSSQPSFPIEDRDWANVDTIEVRTCHNIFGNKSFPVARHTRKTFLSANIWTQRSIVSIIIISPSPTRIKLAKWSGVADVVQHTRRVIVLCVTTLTHTHSREKGQKTMDLLELWTMSSSSHSRWARCEWRDCRTLVCIWKCSIAPSSTLRRFMFHIISCNLIEAAEAESSLRHRATRN